MVRLNWATLPPIMSFRLCISFALLVLSLVHAVPVSTQEIISKSSQGLRLLSLAEGVDPLWKTEDEKLELMRSGIKFVSLLSRYWGLSNLPFPPVRCDRST